MADDSQIRETIAKPKRLVNQPQEKIWAKLNEIASIFRERLAGLLGQGRSLSNADGCSKNL